MPFFFTFQFLSLCLIHAGGEGGCEESMAYQAYQYMPREVVYARGQCQIWKKAYCKRTARNDSNASIVRKREKTLP